MIGQKEIKERISSIKELPHVILLEGKNGSGRHCVCGLISDKFNLPIVELETKGINKEKIDEILLSVTPQLYIINLNKITIREQNVLLKFLEEPLNHCYVVLLCENSSFVLPTVFNRCQHWKLAPYSTEELKEIVNEIVNTSLNPDDVINIDDRIFDMAETPGDVIAMMNCDITSIVGLIQNIVNNIGRANFSNILVLVDKIKEFNKEDGFIEFELFLNIFLYVLRQAIVENSNVKLYSVFYQLQDLYKAHKSSEMYHFNEQQLYEKFLYDLKEILR